MAGNMTQCTCLKSNFAVHKLVAATRGHTFKHFFGSFALCFVALWRVTQQTHGAVFVLACIGHDPRYLRTVNLSDKTLCQ